MAQATYHGEEVTVVFEGDWIKNDYGVPRSPTWWEVDNIEVVEVCIYGVKVDHKKLPPELLDVFYELSDELEQSDWE